jgi:hypothetical protein
MAQQTPAAKASMGMLRRVTPRSKRKGSKAAKRYARNKRTISGKTRKRKSGKPARLVKGSAAAKAYMAKIRRKRKR